MRRPMAHRARLLALFVALLLGGAAPSAFAHGFSSVVYVDATAPQRGHVRTTLGLEYDLLIVSVADTQKDDALFKTGQPAWEDRDDPGMAAALDAHTASVMGYVTRHFGVADPGKACTASKVGATRMGVRESVPYAFLTLDFSCTGHGEPHHISSRLFPNPEGYIKSTKTIVNYDLDLQRGSASLDDAHSTFSTHQS